MEFGRSLTPDVSRRITSLGVLCLVLVSLLHQNLAPSVSATNPDTVSGEAGLVSHGKCTIDQIIKGNLRGEIQTYPVPYVSPRGEVHFAGVPRPDRSSLTAFLEVTYEKTNPFIDDEIEIAQDRYHMRENISRSLHRAIVDTLEVTTNSVSDQVEVIEMETIAKSRQIFGGEEVLSTGKYFVVVAKDGVAKWQVVDEWSCQ